MSLQVMYGSAGLLLFVLGIWSFLVHAPLLRKLIALNVTGSGVFLVLVAVAYRGPGLAPDPVPHALVLTGIVVAVSATALALSLGRRLAETPGAAQAREPEGPETDASGGSQLPDPDRAPAAGKPQPPHRASP
jgi:multicomponent Na+:H+ antiporter subunit C